MANDKILPFTRLDQSKHHCNTLSTTCTLFKLASEVDLVLDHVRVEQKRDRAVFIRLYGEVIHELYVTCTMISRVDLARYRYLV